MAEDFIRVRGGLKLFCIGEQILNALGADDLDEVLVGGELRAVLREQIKPRVSDQLFSLVDVYATVAQLTGQELTAGAAPDSLDLSSVLLGKTKKNVRDNTVLHGIGGLALRQGDWKYIPASTGAGGMGSGANAADARFAAATVPEQLLFNLAKDPNETINLTAKHPDKAVELAKELKAIVAQGEETKKTKAKP